VHCPAARNSSKAVIYRTVMLILPTIIRCGMLSTNLTKELVSDYKLLEYERILSSWYVFGGALKLSKRVKLNLFTGTSYVTQNILRAYFTLLSAISLMFYLNMDFICTSKPV